KIHRTFPQLSILVDTKGNGGRNLWGRHITDLSALPLGETKFVWDPPRLADGVTIDWELADAQLVRFWARAKAATIGTKWEPTDAEPVVGQFCLTEAHKWQGTYD